MLFQVGEIRKMAALPCHDRRVVPVRKTVCLNAHENLPEYCPAVIGRLKRASIAPIFLLFLFKALLEGEIPQMVRKFTQRGFFPPDSIPKTQRIANFHLSPGDIVCFSILVRIRDRMRGCKYGGPVSRSSPRVVATRILTLTFSLPRLKSG